MAPTPLLLAAAAVAVLLLLLALRLRGPRGPRDLTGPPKRRRKRIRVGDAAHLTELAERGEHEEALRLMREWGYSEEDGARMTAFVERIQREARER
jgi:uncharacterized protein YceH (UPF0502 family)